MRRANGVYTSPLEKRSHVCYIGHMKKELRTKRIEARIKP
jgi:hypothetical protein